MATETSSSESTPSNVQPISSVRGTVNYSRTMATKSFNTVANTYKFAWRAWLGTAVTGQQTATSFARDMAKKGEETETLARKKINDGYAEAKSASVRLREQAKTRIDVLEDKVGKGMGRSLHFMGVPTREDVDRLALLMAEMSESIDELTSMKEQQQSKAKRPTSS